MPTSAISAAGSGFASPQQSAFSTLSSEDFTRIILQELSRQDPMQPSDTNSLIQQLSGIRSIQSDSDLSKRLESLVSMNEFASATTVIGSRVSGISLDNARVSGVVRSVARTSYGALLTLEDATRILMSDVDTIEGAPAAETTP
jgi:flagellar basal-body rod modification protein FlgD